MKPPDENQHSTLAPVQPALEGDQLVFHTYNMLKTKVLQYLDNKAEHNLCRAFEFAKSKHCDQRRKSGEPYIVHPLTVAIILAELHMDETSLVAAILHDVVEDTHVSVAEVKQMFGDDVAEIVDGLTKLAKVEFRSNQEKMAENFRKMVLAMSKDVRVIIVKLADRTHNMRTLKALALEKRQRIAEETMEIYAPLAGRLGIYRVKAELEDLCLKELKPSVYFSLVSRVAQKKSERENFVAQLSQAITEKLAEHDIKASVEGRAKHFYSIYKKMAEKKMDFEDIYDLFAFRILVENVSQCYETLGFIHSLYRPVPGRFKDYIAMPKANMYQSLHTTVVTQKGELTEFQIRTFDMHKVCEYGIAAHWLYKEGHTPDRTTSASRLSKFSWLKQIVKHQREIADPNEFLEAVKVDLFEEEVYVFSPKGDVFELPRGSTCLDFAFAVHSDLGLRTVGAKVNGRMATLRTSVESGDVVEIMAGPKNRATKDWLSFVNTSKARGKIRTFLRSEERDDAKLQGERLLEDALEKLNFTIEKLSKHGVLQDVNRFFSVGGFDDLVMQIGYGKIDGTTVAHKLVSIVSPEAVTTAQALAQSLKSENDALPEAVKPHTSSRMRGARSLEESVRVQGMDGVVVRLAKCCEPLPGQPIVGFISRARGVTVHVSSCEWALTNDPARRVDCSWSTDRAAEHSVRLRITTHDKQGLLANITKIVSQSGLNISGAEVQTTLDKRAVISLKVLVSNLMQLKDVFQKLEATDGVIHVERLTG